MRCAKCGGTKVALRRMATNAPSCKECFMSDFEEEVHAEIEQSQLFQPGDRVAVCVSGGKDSTCLLHILDTLNKKHNYGIELHQVAIDEGIVGYRDFSLECVRKNADKYQLPLHLFSFKEIVGFTVDEIAKILGEKKSTHCGIFRRKAMDIGCQQIGANKMALGHNADDFAETVLMNLLRGDVNRLERATVVKTGGSLPDDVLQKLTTQYQEWNQQTNSSSSSSSSSSQSQSSSSSSSSSSSQSQSSSSSSSSQSSSSSIPELGGNSLPGLSCKVKPFKHCFQREIVLYAHFRNLLFFSVECSYAPQAFRGFAREFLVRMQQIYPLSILNIIKTGDGLHVQVNEKDKRNILRLCTRCGFISSQALCQSCQLIEQLIAESKIQLILNEKEGPQIVQCKDKCSKDIKDTQSNEKEKDSKENCPKKEDQKFGVKKSDRSNAIIQNIEDIV